MSDRVFVGTRKGLFRLEKGSAGSWGIEGRDFIGDNVNIEAVDARSGQVYASLDYGHFGTKLHRSDDGGESWSEIAVPTYPDPPEGWVEIPNPFTGKVAPWSLEMIWSIEPGSPDEPGRVWCGTIPGGLFRSDDSGDSWSLVRALWDLEARKHWMGAGMDYVGIHSILTDPRDADHVTVGVGVGGIYHTTDGGESWAAIGEGLRAEYVPPEQAGNPEVQDPHCLVHCLGEPDTM